MALGKGHRSGSKPEDVAALEAHLGFSIPESVHHFFLEYGETYYHIGGEYELDIRFPDGRTATELLHQIFDPQDLANRWNNDVPLDKLYDLVGSETKLIPFANSHDYYWFCCVGGQLDGAIVLQDTYARKVAFGPNSLEALVQEARLRVPVVENDVQDTNDKAWIRLCEYIEELAESGETEFAPRKRLGSRRFSRIHTLPTTISKLKNVSYMLLYGSNIKRIPPEIGQMENLRGFDPYTSYRLHWFPYEITHCKYLMSSTISTRALYGNYKTRLDFPRLDNNPVRYRGGMACGVCHKPLTHATTDQYWITLRIATDVVPLLVNVCSETCKNKLPKPPDDYIDHPHKGGNGFPDDLRKRLGY